MSHIDSVRPRPLVSTSAVSGRDGGVTTLGRPGLPPPAAPWHARCRSISEQDAILGKLAQEVPLLGRRDYAMIATFLLTGVRCSEIARVRLDQLDLEHGTLRVIGKGNKERLLIVIPRLARILRDYL